MGITSLAGGPHLNSTKRNCTATAAFIVLAFAGLSASAGDSYYRWTDSTGTPINSDRPPPPGVEYDVVSTRTNRANLEAPAEVQTPSGVQPGAGSKSGPGESVASAPQPEKDPEICATAQQNLETLNTYARIRVSDGEGSFRFIGEEEKATQRASAEQLVSQHCQ